MFSCTELFNASYFLNTRLNSGIVLRTTSASPTPNTGMTSRKITAILPPMINAIANENTSIRGQRMAVRTIIIYAICTLVPSVVMRVTRLDTENLSMFSKE